MQYTKGSLGRVFTVRLQDGESIYEAVREIAEKENIHSASVMAVGGIRSGRVVTGPKNPDGKIVPNIEEFDDARELVGFGTLFQQDGKPSLHFHAAIGRGRETLVGCPREGMSVYLVCELVIIEMVGLDASRLFDPEMGVYLLNIMGSDKQ